VLFTADAHAGLASGAITVTFRNWQRPQAKVGGRYRVGDVTLLVDDVRQVRLAEIADEDARRAGAEDRKAVLARLAAPRRGRYGGGPPPVQDPDARVWRIEFHRVEPDPTPSPAEQSDVTDADLAELDRRLARLDATGKDGPWTSITLEVIARHPGVVSTTLAELVGRERQAFKNDVRKLKRLGLTESLRVGYRLTPRGLAYTGRRS
jgi:hypothetical protein